MLYISPKPDCPATVPFESPQVYTGIGAREAPADVCSIAEELGYHLGLAGWKLRSGAAEGMDKAFEYGALRAGAPMELSLPWKGYNHSESPCFAITQSALDLAASLHPAWGQLSSGIRKMLASSCYQTLGRDLTTPSRFSICWTEDGCESEKKRTKRTGGTATGIVLADRNGIPLYNLRNNASRIALNRFLESQHIAYHVPVDAEAPEQTSLF